VDIKKEDAPSVKKPRLATPPHITSSSSQPVGEPHDLPPLLSPTFLPHGWDLPPMLSPTLPPNIEAALAREDQPRSRTESNTSTSSAEKKVKTQLTSAATSLKASPPERKALTPDLKAKSITKSIPKPSLASSAMFKSDLKRDSSVKAESPARKISDEHKSKRSYEDEVESRTSTTKAAPESEKQSLILRMKYGRKHRQRIEWILRLPPKPSRDGSKLKQSQALDDAERARASSGFSQSAERRERPETSSAKSKEIGAPKTDAKKIVNAPAAAAKKTVPSSDRLGKDLVTPEKRSRTDESDSAPSAKRHKLPATLDVEKHPRTPIRPPLISPSIHKSGGSAAHITPRDSHLKGAAMSRTASNETTVSTPGNRSYLTPQPKVGGAKPPTSAPSSHRAAELASLTAKSKLFNELGKKLKRENEKIHKDYKDSSSGQPMSETDRKRRALLGLECILSYMLAYGMEDAQRKLNRSSSELERSWLTVLPLFHHLGSSTRYFQHLEGLRYHCGVAICARIQAVIAERFSRLSGGPPSSQEHRDKSDSPHSQDPFNAPNASSKLMEYHVTSWKNLTDYQREAGSKLPVEVIQSQFPHTWKARAGGPRDSTFETLISKDGDVNCQGKFWLPVAVDTSTIQAARFGIELLKEWVKNDKLDYEVQVKL
jgi:hypothetical protein